MDQERWKEIDAILDAALELPAADRERFIAERTADNPELEKVVLDLLRAAAKADRFMERPAISLAAESLANAETERTQFGLANALIANYRIERMIGAGGMGEVYLAFDEKLKRNVALKILPPEFSSHDDRVVRFELEARAVSKLNHPGIVTLYDIGVFQGVNYIATEFVEGRTLRELMGGKFKLRNIIANSIQICDALSAAHESGIVHRDIKPENIMIRRDGYAKVLDFGLAKLSEIGPESLQGFAATQNGTIIGTPAYMSPVQITGDKIDHRTDLWSAGVVLYEFLTGTHPFKEKDRRATFAAILNRPPEIPSSLNPQIPPELDRILLRMLEKDPDDGYQNAGELRNDLRSLLRQIDTSEAVTQSGSGSEFAAASLGREWSLYAAVGFAALLTGFAIYYLFFTEPRSGFSKWAAAENVQITFRAGTEAYPSLSPDGRSLLYVADTGGDDIFLLRVGGSNAINLTADSPNRDTMPAFSPDGNTIAFRSDREPAGIYLMGATGENPRRISDVGYSPTWSPDGKFLAIATGFQPLPSVKTRSAIWIIEVATGQKRMLHDGNALQPSWSPRGDRIAFWRTGDTGERVIETISVSGGSPIVFASEGNTNWNPVWSPDGRFLYFASDRRGNMAVYRASIDIDTGLPRGEAELVPTPGRYNRHIAFSNDGKRMAYVQTTNRSNIKRLELEPNSEKAVSGPEWVTRGDFEFTNIDVSTDAKRIYARLVRKSQDDIVAIATDNGSVQDLTNDLPFDRYPRVSPDGRRVLFVSDRSGKYQLWLMNTDGTELKQLTNDESKTASIPVWSPDGSRITFDDESTTYIAELNDANEITSLTPLPRTANGGWFRVWSWSPDGKLLGGNFDSAHGPGMGYFNIETQTYHRLIDFPAFPSWLPDSRRLLFIRDRKPVIADTLTGEIREVFPEITEEIRNIRITGDGRTAFYSTHENESDVWLLDLAEE